MKKITKKASAKINLCLDVIKKTTSGYHEIKTVYFELKNLHDTIEIYESKQNDDLSIAQNPQHNYPFPPIPTQENLAFKALQLIKSKFNIKKSVQINITKSIPMAAGLGGASSNAAATIKALNDLWKLNVSTSQLQKLAAELGMDVPFFIEGGTALGEHFGEVLTPLPDIKCIELEITPIEKWATPKREIKTAQDLTQKSSSTKTTQMYSSLDLSQCNKNSQKTKTLINAINSQTPDLILQNLHNDFETIYDLPPNTHLSGSGPATFTTN